MAVNIRNNIKKVNVLSESIARKTYMKKILRVHISHMEGYGYIKITGIIQTGG